MSLHIGAEVGEIAETVLLPGDPLRAKWIAEHFLTDVKQYNNVRGMLGFTGLYNGKRVSVQGSGMGIPSIGIYAHELINDYGVKKLIRVGSAGSYQKEVALRDIVLAMSASTNSSINNATFHGETFAPTASFNLLRKAADFAENKGISYKAGNILSSDIFYQDNPEYYKKWASHGVLCVEMETAVLYTTAAKFGVEALSVLTISDSLVTHEATSSQDRETTFKEMIEIALSLV
ncbi:purine-nucleoside phosphorylase [Neptunitalea lumnitzerae]|uniref:Uridine phosphorylase n=1 Tax=Neptunitalea lumnitzerae TaxID=2965509 RepID=A0ABQ5MJZ9_9FLAO|nr:purine-nucleoside phosphorylase [Neptunitalea sp. Y10]GLB49740.1 purine-nucleoside phosphorylase [Neptunitalea sp. Y10]